LGARLSPSRSLGHADASVSKPANRPSSSNPIHCRRLLAGTTLSRRKCRRSKKLLRNGSRASWTVGLRTHRTFEPAWTNRSCRNSESKSWIGSRSRQWKSFAISYATSNMRTGLSIESSGSSVRSSGWQSNEAVFEEPSGQRRARGPAGSGTKAWGRYDRIRNRLVRSRRRSESKRDSKLC